MTQNLNLDFFKFSYNREYIECGSQSIVISNDAPLKVELEQKNEDNFKLSIDTTLVEEGTLKWISIFVILDDYPMVNHTFEMPVLVVEVILSQIYEQSYTLGDPVKTMTFN